MAKIRKNVCVEKWGEFLKNRRAQRLGVYCGIMNKLDTNCIKNIAQRKADKMGNEPISIDKNNFTKKQ